MHSLTSGTGLTCDTCGGDALRLSEAAETALDDAMESEEKRIDAGREAAGVKEPKGKAEPKPKKQAKGGQAVMLPAEVSAQLNEAVKNGGLRIGR
jgi:hypothetical protein